jgi:hypothetical protein
MKREDVLRFANESGLTCVLNAERISYTDWANRMINFAQLAAEQEREACAEICENYADTDSYQDETSGGITTDFHAKLIRARGNAWTS